MAIQPRVTHGSFFADLVRCETRLYNQFNDELRAAYGIVTSQYEFLLYLRDHEQPRTTDMAVEFAVGVGAVSKAVDRLEARGFVERRPHPANRRSSVLVLTSTGASVVERADRLVQARLDEIVGQAGSASQIATAARVVARLRDVLEREGLGRPVG